MTIKKVVIILFVLGGLVGGYFFARDRYSFEVSKFFASEPVPNMRYVGYYFSIIDPGAPVPPNIDDTAAYTNLAFAANVQEVAALRSRGIRAIFTVSFWPTLSSRLDSNWVAQWQAIRDAIRPQVNDGSIWGIYIWDEPYSHGPAGFENDLDGGGYFRKNELEQVIAQIKADFPTVKTMITNSCYRGHTKDNGDYEYTGDLPLIPPPSNLDVYSIDCYGDVPLFEQRYAEIQAFGKDILFTVEALSIGNTDYSRTRQGQEAWMARIRRIAGSNPQFLGVLWFFWPDCPGCLGNLGGTISRPEVRAYHSEVGRQILCANTWEQNPVCGTNGTAYPNPDQAKCANVGIASYGTSCQSANQAPIGFNDGQPSAEVTQAFGWSRDSIFGWAYDADAPTTSIDVHLYYGPQDANTGPGCTNGCQGFVVTANAVRPGLGVAANISGDNHGFVHSIPTLYRDGQPHRVRVYAINTPTGTNPLLPYSGGTQNYYDFQVAPTTTSKPGDIDRNGKVDIFDYNALVAKFGQNVSTAEDIDGSGRVDIFDYNALVQNFGM